MLQLPPEHALQVDLARRRVDGDDDDRAAHLREPGRAEHGGGGPRDLEHDVGTGARRPLLDPGDLVDRTRIERREPEALDLRAALRVELDDDDIAAEVPGDGRDQHADRSAADDDGLLAGSELRAADVVHRDRDRLDERGVVERASRRQRDERLGGHVPQPLQRAGGVDADEVEVLADVRCCRRGTPGQVPSHASGMTVTASPTLQPVTPSPSAAIVPLISCPNTRGVCDAGVHVAVQDVQVGAAEAGVGHRDLHLTGSRSCGIRLARRGWCDRPRSSLSALTTPNIG